MKVTATPIIRPVRLPAPILIGNGVLASLVLISYSLFRPTTPHFIITLALLSGGFLRSLQFTRAGSLAYADVPNPLMSNASSLASMASNCSSASALRLPHCLLHLSLGGRAASALTSHDFTAPFVVVGVLAMPVAFAVLCD